MKKGTINPTLAAIQDSLRENLLPQNEPLPSENPLENETHPIWELWQRMNEMFGHQWASQQGDEPNDTWVKGLTGITPIQYGAGLRALLTRADKWPPNLIEFRQLCIGFDPDAWRHRAEKVVNTGYLIEDTTSKEKRVADGLAALKALRLEVNL